MSTNAHLIAQKRSPRPKRAVGSLSTLAPVVCASVWIMLCIGSLLLSKKPIFTPDGFVVDVVTPLQRQLQLLGSLAIVGGLVTGFRHVRSVISESIRTPMGISIFIMITFMILGAMLRGSLQEISYVVLLAMAIILGLLLWSSPPRSIRVFSYVVGTGCLVFVLVAFALFGLPKGRWLGGIHPNLLGYVFVTLGIFGLSRSGFIGYGLYVASVSLAVLISSRYSLLCLISVGGIHLMMMSWKRIGLAATVVIAAGVAPIVALTGFRVFDDIFLLSDSSRGLSSGASGRGSLAQNSLLDIGNHVVFGAGFRNRSGYEGAHNGYINFLNENGVFVSTAFIVTLMFGLIASMFALRYRSPGQQWATIPPYMFVACCIASYFQPQVFSFGDCQGIFMILSLAGLCVYWAKNASSRRVRPVQA